MLLIHACGDGYYTSSKNLGRIERGPDKGGKRESAFAAQISRLPQMCTLYSKLLLSSLLLLS